MSAECGEPGFARETRARGFLGEEECESLSAEECARVVWERGVGVGGRLELEGAVDQGEEGGWGEVAEGEKVLGWEVVF